MAFLVGTNFLNEQGNVEFKLTKNENITYKIIKIVKEKKVVKYLTPFLNHVIEPRQSEFNTKTVLKQHQPFPSARYIMEKGLLAVATNTFSSFVSKDDAIKVFKNFKSNEDNVYRLYECKIPKNTKYIYGTSTLIATVDNIATDFNYKTISSAELILENDITENIL